MAAVIFIISILLNWNFLKSGSRYLFSLAGFSAATSCKAMTESLPGFNEYAISVMDTYRSIPEEIRERQELSEYRAFFSGYEESEFYREAMEILEKQVLSGSFFTDTYVAMYDQDTSALVMLLDPEPDGTPEHVGYFERVTEGELSAFLKVKEENQLYSYESQGDDGIRLLTTGNAIWSPDGEVIAYAMADLPSFFVSAISIVLTILYLILLGIIIVIVVLISRLLIGRRVVKPINQITRAAEAYTEAHQNGSYSGKYFDGLAIKTHDELEELGRVMSDLEDDITLYEQNLMKATAANERVQTEMSVAARIQRDMLPGTFPPFPDHREFEIYASMDPAKEVGGDFYDFFLVDSRHLGIVIADVSGKGIPAALFMMSAMIIINNYASVGYSPAEVLTRSNEKICQANPQEMFVTVWLGILDLATGVVTATSAGHEYPAIRHAGGDYELLHDRHGFVLGGMEGVRYRDYSFTLEPGSSLFVYTDGVPEATNAEEELYGTDRMTAALNRVKDEKPEAVLTAVRRDVDAFVKEAPQFDDLTMLCLTYHGLTPEGTDNKI